MLAVRWLEANAGTSEQKTAVPTPEQLSNVKMNRNLDLVTFDQNVKNAISAEFGILAVGLPDWWFLRTKSVIGAFGQKVRAGIF